MRVILKKDRDLDRIKYNKNDEFILDGVSWGDHSLGFYYIVTKGGYRHKEESKYFDIDCRDL